MSFSVFNKRLGGLLAVVALTTCTGTLLGANKLTVDKTSVSLTCSLVTGPGTGVDVTLKEVGPAASIVTSATLQAGLAAPVKTGSSATLTTLTGAGSTAIYTLNVTGAACGGLPVGVTTYTGASAFTFNADGTPDVSITTVTITVTGYLTVDKTSAALTCNTLTGPGPSVDVTVKGPAAMPTGYAYPIVVSPPAVVATGLSVAVKTGSSATLANKDATAIFSFTAANGCAGLVSGANPLYPTATPLPFIFRAVAALSGGGNTTIANDISVATVGVTVTSTATPLTPTPNPVTLTCPVGGTSNTATVNVTSAATGGTPFTIDSSLPSWLTIGAPSGSAKAIAATFTVKATACSGTAGSSQNVTLRLKNAPAPDKQMTVSVQYVADTPLTAADPAAKTYNKTPAHPPPGQLP